MSVAQQLREQLQRTLPDIQHLDVQDESHAHARGGESHFRIVAVTEHFEGLSRVQRHRLAHRHLNEQLQRIHALSLQLYTPEEWSRRQARAFASPDCARSAR